MVKVQKNFPQNFFTPHPNMARKGKGRPGAGPFAPCMARTPTRTGTHAAPAGGTRSLVAAAVPVHPSAGLVHTCAPRHAHARSGEGQGPRDDRDPVARWRT